jgi:hypothetical protein
MNLERRIKAFSKLGELLRNICDGTGNNRFSEKLNRSIEAQQHKNSWFTPANVRTSIRAIAEELTTENLEKWTGSYPQLATDRQPSVVGLIFAGNIPLAGFHDFLSVLISGNHLVAKTSSKDPDLIPLIGEIISNIEPDLCNSFVFKTGTLTGFDSVIATGSNNSSRYFEYYFRKYPSVIRKNRNSIAVIAGNETPSEIESLGTDVFTYFGLGCRNVSKIYVPEGYDVMSLPSYWESFSSVIEHSSYANNYDYNKAIYLVNKEKFQDTGHLLLKEDNRLASPVSVLHYEHYQTRESLDLHIESIKENLQCIVSRKDIPFGKSQNPHLWDYADGVDTLEFLLKKD